MIIRKFHNNNNNINADSPPGQRQIMETGWSP